MSLEDRARDLIHQSAHEERRTHARRRGRRPRKPVVRIEDWAAYPHEYVGLASLSLRWGEAAQTLRKWVRSGALRAFRFGHAWRVKKEDAMAFEARGEVKSV